MRNLSKDIYRPGKERFHLFTLGVDMNELVSRYSTELSVLVGKFSRLDGL